MEGGDSDRIDETGDRRKETAVSLRSDRTSRPCKMKRDNPLDTRCRYLYTRVQRIVSFLQGFLWSLLALFFSCTSLNKI